MFRRIFGIGKKKSDTQDVNDPFDSGIAVGVIPDTQQSGTDVVPLHGETLVKKKKDPAEVFNEAVDKLVEKLESINTNLDTQIQQNQKLVERMDTLPELLQSLPESVARQQAAFAEVAEQMRQKVQRDENVAAQLSGIHEKVAAAADVDTEMCEQFKTFSGTLTKLDTDTATQTEWLRHIGQTFTDSGRYLKYTLEKQQKRFYWILGISLGLCLFAITVLTVGLLILLIVR